MEINDIESQLLGSEEGASISIYGSQEGASIEMEDPDRPLINKLNRTCDSFVPFSTIDCCIYRVPERLRKLNETAYAPRVISIGPFHREKKEVQPMKKHKERCLCNILQLPNVRLEDWVTSIRNCEERVRRCYADEAIDKLTSDEFVEMILLDGSFIIENFLKSNGMSHGEDILRDLILLENQLPFFVLEKLYNLMPFSIRSPFIVLACKYFSHFNKQNVPPPQGPEVKHFTDLIRTFHLPSSLRLQTEENKIIHLPYSANELHEAGVKFKVHNSSKCLFDIEFTNDGLLQIPHFLIDDRTEFLIRNIMALEQCHYPDKTYICDYISLMDTFINTAKDVELLVKEKIIVNWIGSNDAVATLFNNLCLEILTNDELYFDRLCEDLTEYYEKPWHSWKATFKRDYLSTPWKTASTVAAVILLLLTFMQTVNSFLSL